MRNLSVASRSAAVRRPSHRGGALEDEQVAVLLAVKVDVEEQLVELPTAGRVLVEELLELLAVDLLALAAHQAVADGGGDVLVGGHAGDPTEARAPERPSRSRRAR